MLFRWQNSICPPRPKSSLRGSIAGGLSGEKLSWQRAPFPTVASQSSGMEGLWLLVHICKN